MSASPQCTQAAAATTSPAPWPASCPRPPRLPPTAPQGVFFENGYLTRSFSCGNGPGPDSQPRLLLRQAPTTPHPCPSSLTSHHPRGLLPRHAKPLGTGSPFGFADAESLALKILSLSDPLLAWLTPIPSWPASDVSPLGRFFLPVSGRLGAPTPPQCSQNTLSLAPSSDLSPHMKCTICMCWLPQPLPRSSSSRVGTVT